MSGTLKIFADKRNTIVHRGISNIIDEDINIIKTICEIAFTWLYSEHKKIKTKLQLNEFYRLHTLSNKEIKAAMDNIKYLNLYNKN